ncbi:MAG: hypothetical protein ABI972_23605 [Acidobacteriota bacterium]
MMRQKGDKLTMIRRVFLTGFCTLLLTAGAMAADVSGKWTGKVPRRDEAVETTFTFKVDGGKLTGTMSSAQGEQAISNGKVEGDAISFTSEANGATVTFKGAVSGNEIKFTRAREGGQAREFVAKRAN